MPTPLPFSSGIHRRGRARLLPALVLAAVACGSPKTGMQTRVTVPPGASVSIAADSLARHRIISSPRLFRLYARATGHDRDLKPGTYLLHRGAGWGEILDAMAHGRGLVHTITIPEGWSLASIVPALARSLGAPTDSVEAAVRDTALLRELDVPTPTLEGYLFPDTYTFPDGTAPRQAVVTMVRRFERAWRPEWNDRLDSLHLSRHDVVTLASIVEREARLPEERTVIAAVYLNRLRKGMLLQADPTVQYARGAHTARVTYADLKVESAYNTYLHPGLPPGPIASPGAPSLEAALHPANVPYLYFVASGDDGHHEFRTTFAEHAQAVNVARQARAADSGGKAAGGSAAKAAPRTSTTAHAKSSRRTGSGSTARQRP